MLDFKQLREACVSRNTTLSAMLTAEGTIADFIELRRQRLHHNREKPTLLSPEGFFRAARSHAEKLWGQEIADAIDSALRLGAVQTADHHAALYSPQSFQGDILFGQMLKAEGAKAIPLLSFSQVPLSNATYARGLRCYPNAHSPVPVPLYGNLLRNQMVTCTPAFDEARLRRAQGSARKILPPGETLEQVLRVLGNLYGCPEVLTAGRYADQAALLGRELYRHALAPLEEPDYCFLEMEALFPALAREDLEHQESILYRMLTDSALRREMKNIHLPNGASVASQIFFAPDQKGRHASLTLEDGVFRGTTMGGEELEFSARPEDVVRSVEAGELLPCLPTAALVTCWERGLCWFGGVFQSCYLPDWQSAFVNLLQRSGCKREAEAVNAQYCAGYISGPIFALFPVEGGAVNAGPLEFLQRQPRAQALKNWMATPIREAHEMGLFEFYHDLVPPGEREEGWYGCIAAYASRYAENLL